MPCHVRVIDDSTFPHHHHPYTLGSAPGHRAGIQNSLPRGSHLIDHRSHSLTARHFLTLLELFLLCPLFLLPFSRGQLPPVTSSEFPVCLKTLLAPPITLPRSGGQELMKLFACFLRIATRWESVSSTHFREPRGGKETV